VCVAVFLSVLQCVAVCCSVLHYVAVCCSEKSVVGKFTDKKCLRMLLLNRVKILGVCVCVCV